MKFIQALIIILTALTFCTYAETEQKEKIKRKPRVKLSGELSIRHKNQDYFHHEKNDLRAFASRLRLNAKINLSPKTEFTARVTSKPPIKENWRRSQWLNIAGDKKGLDEEKFNIADMIDRWFLTYHFTPYTSLSAGKIPLKTDPDNVIACSSFYSYTGIEFTSGFKMHSTENTISFRYGNFYNGVLMPGLKRWGNKTGKDFLDVSFYSLSLSGERKRLQYEIGLSNFYNNITGRNLLSYKYANIEYCFSDKLATSFEVGDNTADIAGSFSSSKITYGIRKLKKAGETNGYIQFINANQNAIFNRYTSLDAMTGTNNNVPQTAWYFKVSRALSENSVISVQHVSIRDKLSYSNKGDSSTWRIDLVHNF